MTRRTVEFGGTGMEITRVGLGTWAIGGGSWSYGWGPQDDSDSVRTIRAAVEAGINWVDTAAEYGLGHSEEVVGRALAGLPSADRPYVFTKCGLTWDPNDPMTATRAVASPDLLRRECESSLRRLGVECIDLLQVHWPPADGTGVEEYWPTMLALKDEGKIHAAGLSNHGVEALNLAEALGHVDTVQPPLSIISQSALSDVIPWSAEHGVGVIVYSPMHSGLLTGRFNADRVARLPEDDWRRHAPDFTTKLPANLEVVAAVEHVARGLGVSSAAVAVAWTLSWPGVTGAIVGARQPGQLQEWADADELALDREALGEIAEAVASAGSGPVPVQ